MRGLTRTVVVAAAVALLLVPSAALALVVTSSNIKDGTIQLRDISGSTRKALTAEAPRVGAVVTGGLGTLGRTRTLTATCPSGWYAVGGEGWAEDGGTGTYVAVRRVRFRFDGDSGTRRASARAVCIR